MNKIFYNKKKVYKRCIGCALAFVISLSAFPLDIIPEFIPEKAEKAASNIVMEAHAETDPDELAALVAWYNGSDNGGYSGSTSPSFTSGSDALSKYSKCFDDETFAADHASDTITLATTGGGSFVFDSEYNPIGTSTNPFSGTLIFTTNANEYNIESNTPIFDYVLDSVTLIRVGDNVNIPININRIGDAGTEVSPLFAMHVKGSGTGDPYNWSLMLDSASAHSYSGVIYEMYDGANINLTFTDNSTHTPTRDNNNNIVSGSIIANNESNKNYGILCGRIVGSSQLTATYTKTVDTAVTYIGTEEANCGGLIGEINASTFELLAGSSPVKVDFQTAKQDVGFICGHAEDSKITLPADYTFSGTVDGKKYAGGIAGYCKNTVVNYESSEGTITLEDCTVKNGTTTGGVFGYYECDTYTNDILLSRNYNLKSCTVSGSGVSGGIAGEYKPTYTDTVTIDLDRYTIGNSTTLNSGTTAGGLFGNYTAGGSVTIKDSDTSTHFVPPISTVAYGGVIGEYINKNYANTLTLSDFTINNLTNTASVSVGGVIGTLTGSTYVSVSNVSVTNVTANNASYFGGIISTLDEKNEGSFIDVTGDFTLSMTSGKTYKGGAIAGSFKTGVIRLAGTTDISGAQAANGYAQLVYENDETLVYALGNGSDDAWTLKRNAAATASDLGQWGEVIRMFDVNGESKNAEDAGIVSASDHKVKIAQGVIDLTDSVTFAKCALNMQLNDGSDHGPLCFADTTTYPQSILLSSAITVTGEIALSGTGLLGLMRDGGNGKYLKSADNSFQGSPDFFTGSISGTSASTDKILLAAGEAYGCDANGDELASDSTGGRIYLSENWGHDAQGLIAFGKGASFSNITIGGKMHVSRVSGSNHLYMSPLMGAMTNGATITSVTVNTAMTADRKDPAKFYIGGVSGVFDGKDTADNPYSLSITGSTIMPSITLTGSVTSDSSYENSNTYAGGVLGLLKGATATKYNVSIKDSDISPTIEIGDDVTANPNESYLGGMIGRVAKNSTNARSITLDTVTMTSASIDTKAKYPGGLLGGTWEYTNLTVDGLTVKDSAVHHKYSGTESKPSGLVFRGTGKWDIKSLSISSTAFNSTDAKPASFGMIVNEAYSGDDGLYLNLLDRGYSLTGVTVPTASTDPDYYVDEIAADTKNNDKNGGDILIGGNGTGIVNINMNADGGTATKIVDGENGTGTYQNRLYEQLGNLVGNRNSRYYYNLDVMMSEGHTKTDGEKFLLWSVNQYAATNIKSNFVGTNTEITDIDLSGLSYLSYCYCRQRNRDAAKLNGNFRI